MKTVYIVKAQSGEFHRFKEWIVKSYFDFEKAWQLCLNAQKEATEIFQFYSWQNWTNHKNKYDENMVIQFYTYDDNDIEIGVKYYVYHLDVEE